MDSAQEWLAENGFVVKDQWKKGEILYVQIDADATRLSDFYSFEQLTVQQQRGTEECWRTFFVMKSQEEPKTSEAWNKNLEAPFLNVLQEIQTKCML